MDHKLTGGETIEVEHVRPKQDGDVLLLRINNQFDNQCHIYVNEKDTYALGMYFKRLGALLTDTRWVD